MNLLSHSELCPESIGNIMNSIKQSNEKAVRNKLFGLLQWSSIFIAIITILFIVRNYKNDRARVIGQVRNQTQLHVESIQRQLKDYFRDAFSDLLFISLDDEVKVMTRDSQQYIQNIFDEHYERNQLSELYVIERDFDGTHRPFMVFEYGEDGQAVEETHDLESEEEEYDIQIQQIRNFAADPSLEAQISPLVRLCVDEEGFVLSVPIRNGDEFMGITAGMIPQENLSDILELVDCHEIVVVADEYGDLVCSKDSDGAIKEWFRAEVITSQNKEFYKNSSQPFHLDKYYVTSIDVNMVNGKAWHLFFLHDEEAHFDSIGLSSAASGYTPAIIVAFLGIAISLLCHNVRKRCHAEKKLEKAQSLLEQKVKERTNELAKANKAWEQSFNSINDAITIHDKDYNIIRANKAAEQIFNTPLDQIVGRKCYQLYHGKDSSPESCPSSKILTTGQTCNFEVFEPHLNKFVKIQAMPQFNEKNEIVGIVHVVQNITELNQVEQDKKELEKQLLQTQKMDAIGTLAGGIAHDFNNVLGSIIGYADLAMDDIQEGTIARSNLEQVLIAGSRAKQLIKQILTFSRKAEEGQKLIQVAPVIEESLKMLRASIPSTIEIRQNIESQDGIISGNPTQIHQVVINLCTNAAHAMGENGGVLKVGLEEVSIDSDIVTHYGDLKMGQYLKLTIKDTGCGIESDVIDRVFEPFFTTKDVDKGTGMGLSVVHGIVKNHNGIITVDSEPQKGTIFNVFLPKIGSGDLTEDKSQEIPHGQGESILLVDDDPSIVGMMTQMLERLGYSVVAKTSSTEALETICAEPDKFDLVITDYAMPGMTGKELAKKLLDTLPDIGVILCTGFSEDINSQQAMNMGIKAFIMKPVDRDEIALIIRNILDKKEITV